MWQSWRQAVASCFEPPLKPPWWARGGHVQTLAGHFWPSPRLEVTPEPMIIPLEDGDRLRANWYAGSRDAVLMLFHGLGGDAFSDYMRRTIRLGLDQGLHVVAVNHRGCGDGAGLAKLPYHSGRAEDLAAVSQHLRNHLPGMTQVAIGFSLSGNILLLLQAGIRGSYLPDLGISVNAPIGLARCSDLLHTGLNKLYNWRFSRRICRDLRTRVENGLLDELPPFPRWPVLHDVDDLYTAPASGFKDRHDYYESCSSKRFLDRINRPTVMITARNDPMVDAADYDQAPNEGPLYVHVEGSGGHMGYWQGPAWLGPGEEMRWMDQVLGRLLTTLLPAGGNELAHVPTSATAPDSTRSEKKAV